MADDDVFLRQNEAWEFVQSIADPTERLLIELSLANALSFFASDADYQKKFSSAPLDLLLFARGMNAFLQKKELLRKVLDGEITDINDLNPFTTNDSTDEKR